MKSNRIPWPKLAAEAVLIMLSVLLALFLDESRSKRAERISTEAQLVAIRAELASNQATVHDWDERHARIAERLAEHRRALPEQSAALFVNHGLRIDRLFGESLFESNVRSTAWETAGATGVARNFDLGMAAMLTDVYGLQDLGPLTTIERITELLFDRATHRRENLAESLVLFEMLFAELRGQEALLLESYGLALKAIDSQLE